MDEPGLTARKVATFDPALFDKANALLDKWVWTEKQKRMGDGTYLIYLPNRPERMAGFYELTGPITQPMIELMTALVKPINKMMELTGIADPVLCQADIAYMPPGGDTIVHTDTRFTQRYSRRYNIALKTNPDCYLYHYDYDLSNETKDHIEPGELWELNNKLPHTAKNHGDTWRTHLIIDVMPLNYWNRMCELFPEPFKKVPNQQGKNHTFDLDLNNRPGNYWKLFDDLPHCFPCRTHT
jgi:hypothetical protein